MSREYRSTLTVGIVAPPFISVPPAGYGGTELFVARLAEGLKKLGARAIVYTNGESTVSVEKRFIYRQSEWPISGGTGDAMKELEHTVWAVQEASESCDVIHLNNAQGVVCSRFSEKPCVCTLHHPHDPDLTEVYKRHDDLQYVLISNSQSEWEPLPNKCTIYHGIDFAQYTFREQKEPYLCFLGRIAPIKGTHLAIAIAHKAGIPLKIAGEVQPLFRDYFETQIRPYIDGKSVEYLGVADFAMKNELLGNSMAMLFPIQWEEPFGLVMIEAMACGTPVLALPGGSVPEIVRNGVSGYVCDSVEDLASQALRMNIPSESPRRYVEKYFSVARMASQYLELYHNLLHKKVLQSTLERTRIPMRAESVPPLRDGMEDVSRSELL